MVFPLHRLVRRRVVAHSEQLLRGRARGHVVRHDGQPQAWSIRADPAALDRLQQILSSYWGHFAHASTWRLRHAMWRCSGWLGVLFCMDAQGSTFAQQVSSLRQQWPQARTVVHKGAERLHLPPSAAADGSRVHAVQTGWLGHGARRRDIVQWHRVPAAPDAPASIP